MDPMVPPTPYVAPTPPPAPKKGWPTAALAAVVALALVAILGVVGGQLMAKSARDDAAELEDRLASTEDDADDELDQLQGEVETLTAANDDLAGQYETASADLATAQTTITDQQAEIAELTAALEATPDTTVPAAGDDLSALFPVGLEDLQKVDLSFEQMALASQVGECTYATDTCDYLTSAVLDADMYQDGGQWILTMRADGVPYFQAALVLDETGSFSGSEFVNAEGNCDGVASKPFATVYINPVEFSVEGGVLRGTRYRGYLSDSTDCGRSTFSFQGRLG